MKAPKSRSGALLKSVIGTGTVSADDMARELIATRAEVDAYLSGETVMPLNQQLCLALYCIEKLPRLARRGHTLRAQVAAAISFQQKTTATHAEPPSSWVSMFRRV